VISKKIKIISISIIVLFLILCGCQEQNETQKKPIADNIEFESDIVELLRADFIEHVDNSVLLKVEVKYLLKNIAGRVLDINRSIEFYDVENNLLFTSATLQFLRMADGYEETEFEATNSITYAGENASDVDHAKIIVEEIN